MDDDISMEESRGRDGYKKGNRETFYMDEGGRGRAIDQYAEAVRGIHRE
jgi:hypothetical protein